MATSKKKAKTSPAPKKPAGKGAPAARPAKPAPKAAKRATAKPSGKPAAKKPAKAPAKKNRPAGKDEIESSAISMLKLAPPPAKPQNRPPRKNVAFVDQPIPADGLKKPHKKPNPVTFVRKPAQALPPKPASLSKADMAAAAEQAKKARMFAYEIAEQMKAANSKADSAAAAPGVKLPRRPSSRGPGNGEHFPQADLEQFRKVLLALRESVEGRSGALKSVALDQIDPHALDDEDGTDAYMRFQALGQVGSHQAVIQKIDQALRAIDDGVYGVCSECGQLIRKPRLLQMPFATTCMECQTAIEKPFGGR